jgi:hypothetical protein
MKICAVLLFPSLYFSPILYRLIFTEVIFHFHRTWRQKIGQSTMWLGRGVVQARCSGSRAGLAPFSQTEGFALRTPEQTTFLLFFLQKFKCYFLLVNLACLFTCKKCSIGCW